MSEPLTPDPAVLPSPAPSAPPLTPALPLALTRWLHGSLVAWAAGVQLSEGLASAGLVACALGLAVWAWRAQPAGALPATLRGWWPLWLFLAWGLLGSTLAGRPPSGTGVARLGDWAALPLALLALERIGPARARSVLASAGGVLVLSSAVAGLQHFGAWPSQEALGWLEALGFPVHRVYEPVPGAPGRFMAGGLLFHRLKFAHVSGLVVLVLLACGQRARGQARWLALGAAGVGFVAVGLFPHARAASAALLLAAVAVGVLGAERRARALAVGASLGLLALGLALAQPSLRSRFASSLDAQGNGERVGLVRAGAAALATYPVAGTGAGRFRLEAWWQDGPPPHHVRVNAGKAHNQLLSIGAELGLVGLGLFLLLLGWLARRMRAGTAAGAAGLGALLFFLLLGSVHDPLFQAPFSMALVLALAAGLQGRRR